MSMKRVRKNTVALLVVAIAVLAMTAGSPVEASCPSLGWVCAEDSTISYGTCYHFPATCRVCHSNWQDQCRQKDLSCDRGQTPARRIDGCSAGDPHFTKVFKPACDEHDACYSTPGRTKKGCDDNFLLNMLTLCVQSGVQIGGCNAAAASYEAAVRMAPQAQQGYDDDQKWAAKNHCGNPQPVEIVFSRQPGSSSQTVSYWAGSSLPAGGGGPVPDFVNPPQPAWVDIPAGGAHAIKYTSSQPIDRQIVFFNIIKDNDKDHPICAVSAELTENGTLTNAKSDCPSSIRVTTNRNEVAVNLPVQL
jgi:hypothetical protein